MALRLHIRDDDFEERFAALLGAKARTIRRCRRRGAGHYRSSAFARRCGADRIYQALRQAGPRGGQDPLDDEAIEAAISEAGDENFKALRFAAERIEAHHRRQLPVDDRYTDSVGAEIGYRWTAIEAVGLYVPGGQASYPSSVLMNAIPAKVAGVPRIAMCVPAPGGEINRLGARRRASGRSG